MARVHEQVPFYFPTFWMNELFANIAMVGYVMDNEPDLVEPVRASRRLRWKHPRRRCQSTNWFGWIAGVLELWEVRYTVFERGGPGRCRCEARQTPYMRFRMATRADVSALANLRWTWRVDEESGTGVNESRDAFVQRFSAFAAEALSGRWTVWVAEDDEKVIANTWIYRVPKVPSPGRKTRDFGYMTNVYTVPGKRDLGIGGDLLAAVTAWAHDADLELIIVWPSERSVPWYVRAGYSPSTEVLEREVAGYEG